MNTWRYDLKTEADPLVRLGVHGLWRHLQYSGEAQTESVYWVLTDTTITLKWAKIEDLNRLMSRMVGDLSDGFMVPPNYVSERTDQAVYATVLAHKGITQHFFAKKGAARSRSEAVPDKVEPAEAPWSREDKPARLRLGFTRHRLHDTTPEMTVSPKGEMAKKQKLGVVFHPMVSQWNMADVTVDAMTKFALAFSCLAHVFTQDSAGEMPYGLGVDAPTFSAADALHDAWMNNPLFRAPDEVVCGWAVAALLDLPPGTYVQVSARGASYLPITGDEAKALYPILQEGMGGHAGAKAVRLLETTEVQPARAGKDAYAQIINNVRLGRAWYTDVHPVTAFARTRTTLTNIFNREATEMEQQIANQMQQIRWALSREYATRYGLDKARSYERADNLIINVHLNRARNRPALLKALSDITRQAGRGFTKEELAWILERSERRWSEVRSLLILACTTFYGSAQTKKATETETDTNIDIDTLFTT